MHDARTHGHISAESSSETLRHTQVSGTETRPVNPAQNTDHESLEARCSYLFLVSAVFLKFFVVLVPILVSSVILQIVSSAFLEVSNDGNNRQNDTTMNVLTPSTSG
jgi:hypothetical protein